MQSLQLKNLTLEDVKVLDNKQDMVLLGFYSSAGNNNKDDRVVLLGFYSSKGNTGRVPSMV
jgi:hypothetical protein